MKNLLILLSLFLLITPTTCFGQTNLFNGKDFTGWHKTGAANWSIVDGVIQTDSGNGMLISDQSYTDFHLTLEFWVSEDANSGVFIRCTDPAAITQLNAYEVNIFDKRPDQTYRTGSIVGVSKPAVIVSTGNKWNTYDITAQGKRLLIKLNGSTMVDVEDGKFPEGPFGLQGGGGTIKFRNIKIKSL